MHSCIQTCILSLVLIVNEVLIAEKLRLFSLISLINHLHFLFILLYPALRFLSFQSFLVVVIVEKRFVILLHIDSELMYQRSFLVEIVAIAPNFVDMGMELACTPIGSTSQI